MNMKKLLALLLAVVMVFGIVACTPADPTNPGTNPTDPTDPKNPTDPTDPQGPTDPTDPTDPSNPVVSVDYSTYYQSYLSEDNGTANYWDSKDSTAGSLISYFAGSFWGTVMNEEKDGYDWVCELANEKPVAVNPDENGLATIYKFEVKVGSEAVYNTLSAKPEFAAFAGREIQLEDYLTTWKEMYNKSNNIARGAEGLTGAGSIKGLQAYYEGTAEGFNQELWDAVGIEATMEDGKAYLTFEFNELTNPFYAMYYLNGSLTGPIPAEFLELIGGLKNYATFANDGALTPVDTSLSTSYYVLESWQFGKEIVFKKNAMYEDNGLYQIPGLYYMILTAAANDPEAGLKEFLAGHLDAVSIPSTRLEEFKNDPRATVTLDSATQKLNLNTCTQEEWEALFGENGSITKTPKENYWNVKPIMSNNNFIKGLSYSLNRQELAKTLGRTPTANYLGSSYLSDPENGVSYNSTEAHKNAVASFMDGTDGYGYSLALAQQAFKAASDELIAAGAYKEGEVVEVEIAWFNESQYDSTGKIVEKYIEDAFNGCGGGLKLDLVTYIPSQVLDIYYKKMMVGQFDIGYGGIEGNPLNPLNFFEVLKSDNSSTFTLNWGVDTSVVSEDIVYDGRTWSFDSLWTAADQGALVDPEGNLIKTYDVNLLSSIPNADGTRTVKFNVGELSTDVATSELAQIVIFGYTDGSDYIEEPLEFAVENGVATAIVTAEQETKYAGMTTFGYDCYFNVVVNGETNEAYKTVHSTLRVIDEEGNLTETVYDSSADADFKAGEAIVMAGSGEWVTYVAASYEERTEILGILEKWAVENFLTGLTLFGDGGYVMYAERVNPGTGDWTNYIPGYGFGVLAEGDLLG